MSPFGHTFTILHRIPQGNHRYRSYDSILDMTRADDATGNAIDSYFARNRTKDEDQTQKASVESQNRKDLNKWNISPPKFNVTTPSVSLIPPNVTLPDMNMTMPSLPKLDIPKLDLDLASSKRFIEEKLKNNDEEKEPTVEVISEKKQKFRNLKLEIPSMNVKDIPRPWTRSYDASISDEKEVTVTDVDEVLDLSDEHEESMKKPVDLFGVLPQLEFDFNLQFDPFKKEDAPGGETEKAKPFLLDALTSSICQMTGKDKYQFGDLSRYIDSCVKDYMRNMQNDSQDLAQRLDRTMEQKIEKIAFTKAQAEQNVQTVTRTLMKKIATGEYELSEITFLCKVLVALGADFAPVAGVLPVGILLELFGLTVACGIGERFFTAIVKELDRRLQWNEEVKVMSAATEHTDDDAIDKDKDLVLSNSAMNQRQNMSIPLVSPSKQDQTILEAYTPGDLTKQAIQEYTGSEYYQVGSITEKTVNNVNDESEDPIDVIRELEECLAMERELVQKLNVIRSQS